MYYNCCKVISGGATFCGAEVPRYRVAPVAVMLGARQQKLSRTEVLNMVRHDQRGINLVGILCTQDSVSNSDCGKSIGKDQEISVKIFCIFEVRYRSS